LEIITRSINMLNITDPAFREQFLADLATVEAQGDLALSLSPTEVLTLISHLQLALRHPGNRGHSAIVCAALVGRLIVLLGQTETLRVGLSAGNDPRHGTSGPAYSDVVVRPIVVCLCGSSRFRDAYQEAFRREEECGRICLTIHSFKGDPCCNSDDAKARLDELHLRKIDLADEILVLDVGGYIGASTRQEINHATRQGKRVRYLSRGN
jgi:hypothetical protein